MRILFFSPYAFVNVWAYPEAAIAESFRQRGHDVFQVRCDGLYANFCIAMASINLTPRSSEEDRHAVCHECRMRRDRIRSDFGFGTFVLDDYLTPAIRDKVEAQLKQVTQANWPDIVFDGIPIPRFASYEYLLNEKVCTTAFKPEQWDGFMTHVRNAMLTAETGRQIFGEIKPDAVLAYNTNYGCNHVMCALAEERGIPHYAEHQGRHHKRRMSEMTIFRGLTEAALVNKSDAWRKLQGRPLGEADVALVSEHVTELMEATSPWVYTVKAQNKSAETLRDFFGIEAGQKVLLVTMASGDERFAADLIGALPAYREPMFASQLVWIRALLRWIEARTDCFLVLRVHPREFPNKREAVVSEQSKLLREAFVDLPANCRVNWPEDALSLHDIAKITDVCLNATSTAGLELLLFGIPVVIYDEAQFFAYPPELNFCARSVEAYWQSIEAALAKGRSADNVIAAFRWIAFLSNVMSIDIGDVYGSHFEETQALPPVPVRRNVLSRLRHRLLGRRRAAAPIVVPPDDPYMNADGFAQIKNGRWLAYAVEHRAASHLDALSDEIAATELNPPEIEFAAVATAAKAYFRTVGMPPDIFEHQPEDASA